jgi:hypothetical protein
MTAAALAAILEDALGGTTKFGRVLPFAFSAGLIMLLVVEGAALQVEIADYRDYGEPHRVLCERYGSIDREIPRDRPLLLINRGTRREVERIADDVRGIDKTLFVRRDALWQLVFLDPLANFVGDPFQNRLQPIGPEVERLTEEDYTVLVFDDSGFSLRPDLLNGVIDVAVKNGALPVGVTAFRWVPARVRR